MLESLDVSTASPVKLEDAPWGGEGLRDFFLHRGLGMAAATRGRVIVQSVKANGPPKEGTGNVEGSRLGPSPMPWTAPA